MLISKFRSSILSQNYSKSIQNIYILNRKLSGVSKDDINLNEASINVDVTKYYLPEPPMDPELLPKFVDLNHLGEPTFKSLGLNNYYWPSGWIQYLYEIMHVDLGLPWWAVIISSGVVFRIIMSPLSYKIKKLTIINSAFTPKYSELEKKLHLAQISHDSISVTKIMQEQHKLLSSSGFSPIKSVIYTLAQIPIFVSVMIGLKSMTELPVVSLQTGGLFWFKDLTLCDPYYILPMSTMALLYLQLEIGADVKKNANSGILKWGIRCVPLVGLALSCNFSSALLLYWWTSSCLSLLVSGIMSIPLVKTRLGLSMIEAPIKNMSAPKQGFYENYKETQSEKQIMKLAKKLEDIEHENWIKAGTAPVPKTYKYDPTKIKPTQIN